MNLNTIADMVHQNAKEKGFHPPEEPIETFIANQCCNMHAEITEHWDAWRAGTQNDPCDKATKMTVMNLLPLTCSEEEMADLIIRALDVSKRLGFDVEQIVLTKHKYNTTRPFKHGKKN